MVPRSRLPLLSTPLYLPRPSRISPFFCPLPRGEGEVEGVLLPLWLQSLRVVVEQMCCVPCAVCGVRYAVYNVWGGGARAVCGICVGYARAWWSWRAVCPVCGCAVFAMWCTRGAFQGSSRMPHLSSGS